MKTDWYPSNVSPEREGWYECQYSGCEEIVSRWWNGWQWLTEPGGSDAYFGYNEFCAGEDRWRGLSKEHQAHH